MSNILNGFGLQTGDHIYVERKDAAGAAIRFVQGDFKYNHMLTAFDEKRVASTGAQAAGLLGDIGIKDRFGILDAEMYLANYDCICVKRMVGLTDDERTALRNVLWKMVGIPYDMVALLKVMADRGHYTSYLGKKPLVIKAVNCSVPPRDIVIEMKRMYCVQSVDYAYWKIGRKIGFEDGKLDPTAPNFRTLYDAPGFETVYEGSR